MKMLVAGGRLQGTEIVYLAQEAGWQVTLVDRDRHALASKLCDCFECADALRLDPAFLAQFDLVVPALEDLEVLLGLQERCAQAQVPFAFDENAYRISSSKQVSARFIGEVGIATPQRVDDCIGEGARYLAKPDGSSGSKGVRVFESRSEALAFAAEHPGWVCQAFLDGAVLSVEVVCAGQDVRSNMITEVVVDGTYDCFAIVAPAQVTSEETAAVRQAAERIGRALDMRGIFDVELIMHGQQPYVLEIDARVPSQTPIAIYHATGANLVHETACVFVPEARDADAPASGAASGSSAALAPGAAMLQHLRIEGGSVELVGEGCLADAQPLERADGLFGAERALASGLEGPGPAFATLVVGGRDRAEALERMDEAVLQARIFAQMEQGGSS